MTNFLVIVVFLALCGSVWLYGQSVSPIRHAKRHRGYLNYQRTRKLEGDTPEEEFEDRIEWINDP